MDAVRFVKGEDHLKSYKLTRGKVLHPGHLRRLRLEDAEDPTRNRGIAIVALGALDDDPGMKAADCNIFVADKCDHGMTSPTICRCSRRDRVAV